jgi:hypothetical protein
MDSIFIQTLPGRIVYEDLKDACVDDFLYEFRGGVGVIHQDRKYINYSDIFWGETEENPARVKGSTKKNIKGLASSRKIGIDVTAELPAVSPCVITDLNGNVYRYKAENGITRKKADFYNGYKEGAWFDVVNFVESEGRSAEYNREVWLQRENDGLPQESHTVDDIVSSCSRLIVSGDLKKEEIAIRDFVYESAPNMATQEKNEAVRQVLKNEDVPTVTIGWRDTECREWLEDKCLDEVEIDYCFPFHYFQDRIYSLLKQYYETGKVQEVAQHFENTGDNDDVVLARRQNSEAKWEECRKVLESIAKYMVLNNWELPVSRKYAFPQIKNGDNKEDTNRLVNL